MQATLAILAVITTCLPEIQRTLGEVGWLAFADRLREQAMSFQNLVSEADLRRAVDELMVLFIEDERVSALITEIEPEDVDTRWLFGERPHPSNSGAPPEVVKVDTVANRFFFFCEHADLIASGATWAEIAARASAQRADELFRSHPTTRFSANRTDRG